MFLQAHRLPFLTESQSRPFDKSELRPALMFALLVAVCCPILTPHPHKSSQSLRFKLMVSFCAFIREEYYWNIKFLCPSIVWSAPKCSSLTPPFRNAFLHVIFVLFCFLFFKTGFICLTALAVLAPALID